jgi:hypothetical protein
MNLLYKSTEGVVWNKRRMHFYSVNKDYFLSFFIFFLHVPCMVVYL